MLRAFVLLWLALARMAAIVAPAMTATRPFSVHGLLAVNRISDPTISPAAGARTCSPFRSRAAKPHNQRRTKSDCFATGSVRAVSALIWDALSGVNSRARATFSSSWATESQPTITVLTGSDST